MPPWVVPSRWMGGRRYSAERIRAADGHLRRSAGAVFGVASGSDPRDRQRVGRPPRPQTRDRPRLGRRLALSFGDATSRRRVRARPRLVLVLAAAELSAAAADALIGGAYVAFSLTSIGVAVVVHARAPCGCALRGWSSSTSRPFSPARPPRRSSMTGISATRWARWSALRWPLCCSSGCEAALRASSAPWTRSSRTSGKARLSSRPHSAARSTARRLPCRPAHRST